MFGLSDHSELELGLGPPRSAHWLPDHTEPGPILGGRREGLRSIRRPDKVDTFGDGAQRNPNAITSSDNAALKPPAVSVVDDMDFIEELKTLGGEPGMLVPHDLRKREIGELSALVRGADRHVVRQTWSACVDGSLIPSSSDG